MKNADSLTADELVKAPKIVFAEIRLPKKIISDAGMNFTSDTFRQFCRKMNIKQAMTLSYHHQSKHTIKKCIDTNNDVILALLQIRLMPIGAGLSSPAMLLFIRPIRGLLPQMNREPININNNDACYEALTAHQSKYIKDKDIHKDSFYFPIWSTVTVQCEDGGCWRHSVINEANDSENDGRSYIE